MVDLEIGVLKRFLAMAREEGLSGHELKILHLNQFAVGVQDLDE
jgi:hypothetical protein